MELKINEIMLPQEITFNYEELKAELTDKVQKYETMVYTDDQIKEAKEDKANLNKLKKALNDERIKREKEYMKPFNEFKAQINEIIAIIDKPVMIIDKQVKEYDEKRKAEKRIKIGAYWDSTEHVDFVSLAKIFDERWLNTGYSMKQIEADITGWINRTNSELATLQALPEFSYEAIEEYKRTLDINKAISEGKRLADIQKRKAEQEAKAQAEAEAKIKAQEQMKAEAEARAKAQADAEQPKPVDASEFMTPPVDDTKPAAENASWIKFEALLTVDNAKKLKAFFENNNIEFKPL